MITSAWRKCSSTAARISWAVSTWMTSTWSGRKHVGPVMKTTGPRLRALASMARWKPVLPEERLEMKRTGSMGSRVGPEVMMIFLNTGDIQAVAVDGLGVRQAAAAGFAVGQQAFGRLR